jgi:hypothetical protein
MDLAIAWRRFAGIVRTAQDAVALLHGYFRQAGANIWEQSQPIDRSDMKELLGLLGTLESSLSEQTEILGGLRPILPPVNVVPSDLGPCLDRLRCVVRGFSDDVTRDSADGDLCFRVCPRYLKLREVLDTLTLLEEGYSSSRKLEEALASDPAPSSSGAAARAPSNQIPESTKTYLTSWGEILATLKLKKSDRDKVARLNAMYGGPIVPGGRGEQPTVEKGELFAWHEGLAVRLEEIRNQRADRQATAVDGYDYGKAGTVAFGGSGSVKKRRRDRKP